MKLITVTDGSAGTTVQPIISAEELASLTGIELAALTFPAPTDRDVVAVNNFLDHYRSNDT